MLPLIIFAWLLSLFPRGWVALFILLGVIWLAQKSQPAPPTPPPADDDASIPWDEPFNDGSGWFAPATPHDWDNDLFAAQPGNEQFFD